MRAPSGSASISAVRCAIFAAAIWHATKRSQISRYSFSSSGCSRCASESGVRLTSVGRIASCASCALALLL